MLYRIQLANQTTLSVFRGKDNKDPSDKTLGWGPAHPIKLLSLSETGDSLYAAMTACMTGEWLTEQCMDILYPQDSPVYSVYAIEVKDENALSYDYAGQCLITEDDVVSITEIVNRDLVEEIIASNKSYSIKTVYEQVIDGRKNSLDLGVRPAHVLEPHSAVSIIVYLDGTNVWKNGNGVY